MQTLRLLSSWRHLLVGSVAVRVVVVRVVERAVTSRVPSVARVMLAPLLLVVVVVVVVVLLVVVTVGLMAVVCCPTHRRQRREHDVSSHLGKVQERPPLLQAPPRVLVLPPDNQQRPRVVGARSFTTVVRLQPPLT